MSKHEQIDNSALEAKLDLRRRFLDKYHAQFPINVLDCCRGDGVIWSRLREEYPVTSYWGVDYKKKPGYLVVDSRRLLKTPGWPQNVIDIDTYGSPWEHWLALIKNVSKPTTVFLTIGDQNSVVRAPRKLSAEHAGSLAGHDGPQDRTERIVDTRRTGRYNTHRSYGSNQRGSARKVHRMSSDPKAVIKYWAIGGRYFLNLFGRVAIPVDRITAIAFDDEKREGRIWDTDSEAWIFTGREYQALKEFCGDEQ